MSLPLEPPPLLLKERIRDAIAAQPAPTVGARWPRVVALAGPPLIACGAVVIDGGLRGRSLWRGGDLSSIPWLALWVALVAVVGTSMVALSRGRDGLGPSVGSLRASVGALVLLSVVSALLGTWVEQEQGPALHPWGLPCMALALAIALGSLTALAYWLRHGAPMAAGWRAAALGAAAAAWGGLTLALHCPAVELDHLLAGHVLPVVLSPAVAALALIRLLRT